MKKKFRIKALVFGVCLLCLSSLVAFCGRNVSAAIKIETRSGGGTAGCDSIFLGLLSWDCNIHTTIENEDDIQFNIWQIAANVATDITIIAAYLVIGYIIYGGYLYTLSSGDPGKVATGKKALLHAFIGLAIVLSANLVMSTARFALLRNDASLGCVDSVEKTGGGGEDSGSVTKIELEASGACQNAGKIVENAIRWAILVAGVVSAIFVVLGGISYISSTGDPAKLQKAKNMILYALIGLAIVALAEVITAFVSNIINKANSAAYETTSIIAKEEYEK